MSVFVTFECDGCSETDRVPVPHRKFHSFDGKGYGFGVWEEKGLKDVIPDGWVYPDPFTGCCYCENCWGGIISETA